jgi:hypothetical protein
MASEKTQTLNALRTKVLTDTLNQKETNRFGLFSFPPAGVWGDGDYTFNKSKKLGQDGKPVTQPRGLYSGPGRSGKTESSFFSKSGYTTIGDKYIDPSSIERQYQLAKKNKNAHESEFKPANGTKSDPIKSLFEHKTELNPVKKNYRGPDGKVIVPPKNITTNPPKIGHGASTVGHLFNKTYPHMAEPYSRQRELEMKEHEAAKKKLQEQAFKVSSHGGENFNKDKNMFGKDEKVLQPGQPKPKAAPLMKHEAPFKPSNPPKQGYNKTIDKFPEYKPDPIKQAVRKIEDPSKKKESFKPNDMAYCERPTPSVSLNKINLKNEMSRISAGY